MKTRNPTSQEIQELVAFLPRLYAEGFAPIKEWRGETAGQDGVIAMPWPEYDEAVEAFFQVASSECWTDYDYLSQETGRMLMDEDAVRAADLAQIKAMLTYCARGERFAEGHWAEMIECGHVRRLLERLAELGSASV